MQVNETEVTKYMCDVLGVHGGVAAIDVFNCHFGPASKLLVNA